LFSVISVFARISFFSGIILGGNTARVAVHFSDRLPELGSPPAVGSSGGVPHAPADDPRVGP
jgi:hypothetical protein